MAPQIQRTPTAAPPRTLTPPPRRRAPEPPAAEPQETSVPWYRPTPARLGFLLAFILIVVGLEVPTEHWLSPERGTGYVLGIVGGSAMLLLLLYPARKHWKWLEKIGSVKRWFQIHMVLGIAGPLCILYHSNFSFGATNSNAALLAMIIVSSSGIVGRYFYARIHSGLYGHKMSHTELRASADELRSKVAGSTFVPGMLAELDAADQRMIQRSNAPLRVVFRPFTVTPRMWLERARVTRHAVRELRAAAAKSRVVAERHTHFEKAIRRYIARRLQATRAMVEFTAYERLFSLWHMLHLPLFFILLIAGIVHVIAVHVY